MERYEKDDAYRKKIDRIREGLMRNSGRLPEGFILDIGGNTAGEATVLQQEGARFVVGDINELALVISKQRTRLFGLLAPGYCALDVHNLPFADDCFECVTVIEALHHFPDYKRALAEIYRVLRPGGQLVSIEPNGLSPLRRLSEVRDRLRGTIEKSFFRTQLVNLLSHAGFEAIDVEAKSTGRSSWKLEEVPVYRRWLARSHGWLGEKFPRCFGSFVIYAIKRNEDQIMVPKFNDWTEALREPGGCRMVDFNREIGVWVVDGCQSCFPVIEGIPVLIDENRDECGQRKS